MNVRLLSIDLAKTVFQVCGTNQAGKSLFNKAVSRKKLVALLAQYPGTPIAMESCPGSNHWARVFEAEGRKVFLIPPQHVKPFVKGNKNDRNDAFAISEAARRPGLRCVRPRTLEQTDMILEHRVKERRTASRTALTNQVRGILSEYGIVVGCGPARLRKQLPLLLEEADNGLTDDVRHLLHDLLEEWQRLDEVIDLLDRKIRQRARNNPNTRRLMAIKGVGPIIATAAVATLGDGSQFKNGRHFSANLGLVPKEHSSGGKQKLGQITKRGNNYLRRILVQGAWSLLKTADASNDRLSRWARQLKERRGKHKAAIAIANKLARIIWAMVHNSTEYQPG